MYGIFSKIASRVCSDTKYFVFLQEAIYRHMAQQLTIKQIATLAGVSAGTVDRVLHNRGKVSEEALAAVQAVLKDQSYRYNLHSSAIAFKKTGKIWNIVITIPFSKKGEYWDLIKSGIDQAMAEYGDFSLKIEYVFFDQFNSNSCRETFEKIKKMDCSAVIIGTTFVEETQNLCKGLDKKGIPYFFVDGKVTDTKPKAVFMANQTACGRLLARLMDGFVADDAEIAVLLPKRIGTQLSNNSAIRLASFRNYFKEKSRDSAVKEFSFSADNEKKAGEEISAFLKENPAVKGIAVVISTAYLISGAVEKSGFKGICVGGFDATEGNSRCIREGSLDFIINQHPDKQGFNAVEATLHYLLYGTTDNSADELMPIDIVFKENLIP